MGNKLFVGNLSFDTTSAELKELFSRAGTCESAQVITDRATGRSRGFGFVEMGSTEEAQKAVAEFNGFELSGRTLNVNEARERAPRSFGGGGNFSSPGGGGGGFSDRFQAPAAPFRKEGGSRRGLRAKKRSIY